MQTVVATEARTNGRSTPAKRSSIPIDTSVAIVTPENISFQYQAAGPFRRLCAFLVDTAVIVSGLILLAILGSVLIWALGLLLVWLIGPGMTGQILGVLSTVFAALYLVTWFTAYFFYGGLFETYWSGQTPGKWLLSMRTLTTSGEPVSGWQAVLRNILRMVDAFPLLSPAIFAGTFLDSLFIDVSSADVQSLDALSHLTIIPTFMLGLGFMMMNHRFQRIGDLVCDTMVVLEERSWLMGVASLEDPRTSQLAALLPPKFQVSRSLAIALATYVERRRFFSPPRRREIAKYLAEPLLRRFGMPPDTSHDLLLCALYYRTFVADRNREDVNQP